MIERLDKVWLAISKNPDTGEESLCAAIVDGHTFPLIAFTVEQRDGMQEQAEAIAVQHGIEVRIIKLHQRTDEGFIDGKLGLAMKIKWPDPGTAKGN